MDNWGYTPNTFVGCTSHISHEWINSAPHIDNQQVWADALMGGKICTVTNQPSVRDWVIQVTLWPCGLGLGLWNQWPRIHPGTVCYTGGSSNPPWLKVARARGLGFQKGGSNVTKQPSVSDWILEVPLWPRGLGVGLWYRPPMMDPCTVCYSTMTSTGVKPFIILSVFTTP